MKNWRTSLSSFYLFSLLLHLALLLSLFLFFVGEFELEQRQNPQAPLTEIHFFKPEKGLTTKSPRKMKSRTGIAHLLPQSLKAAATDFEGTTPANSNQIATENSSPVYDLSDPQTYQEGRTNFIGTNDNWEFLREVFNKVDSQIIFDSLLAQYNHFGAVYIEFTVARNGQLLKVDRAEATDPVLKVHSIRAIRNGLAESFKATKFAVNNDSIKIKAKFEYLLDTADYNIQKQKVFSKPVLIFTRATPEKPMPTNIAEHLVTGGVQVEVIALVDRWKKFLKKRQLKENKFDPFDSYRRDPEYHF